MEIIISQAVVLAAKNTDVVVRKVLESSIPGVKFAEGFIENSSVVRVEDYMGGLKVIIDDDYLIDTFQFVEEVYEDFSPVITMLYGIIQMWRKVSNGLQEKFMNRFSKYWETNTEE